MSTSYDNRKLSANYTYRYIWKHNVIDDVRREYCKIFYFISQRSNHWHSFFLFYQNIFWWNHIDAWDFYLRLILAVCNMIYKSFVIFFKELHDYQLLLSLLHKKKYILKNIYINMKWKIFKREMEERMAEGSLIYEMNFWYEDTSSNAKHDK